MAGVEQKIGTLDGTPVLVITAPNGKVAAIQDADQVQARIDALDAANAKDAETSSGLTPEKSLADRQAALDRVAANIAKVRASLDGTKLVAEYQAQLAARIAGRSAQKSVLVDLKAQIVAAKPTVEG